MLGGASNQSGPMYSAYHNLRFLLNTQNVICGKTEDLMQVQTYFISFPTIFKNVVSHPDKWTASTCTGSMPLFEYTLLQKYSLCKKVGYYIIHGCHQTKYYVWYHYAIITLITGSWDVNTTRWIIIEGQLKDVWSSMGMSYGWSSNVTKSCRPFEDRYILAPFS